jgi:cell division septation protein DedD
MFMVNCVRVILLIVVMFSWMGTSFSQMDWSNIKDLVDYKKELKPLLKSAEKKGGDGTLSAKIGECYYMLNQMEQAQSYYEKAISQSGLTGKYKLQYAKTLMAQGEYAGAKQWFLAYADEDAKVGNHYAAQIDKIAILNKIAPIYQVKGLKQNNPQSEVAVSLVGSDVYFMQNHATKGKNIQRIMADGSVSKVNTGIDLTDVSYFNYSGNGRLVCFTKQATFSGQRLIPEAGLDDQLFIAAVSPSGEWVNTVKYTHNDSGFNCSYPAFDFSGTTLFFSSDRADGFGGQDIYMSIKDGSGWSFPVNAGSEVNTPGHEITPHPTPTSLFFSSNWNVGFGGYDIYRAAKSGDAYTKVYHQGASVNSTRDDYGFMYNEKSNTAYFVSNRATGKGLEDIYIASKPDENYVINVKDATNNNSIERVALDLSACGGTQTFTDENGQFVFQLLSDSGCRIRVEKPGYEITFLEVSKAKGREYTVLIESNYPTVVGQVLDQTTGMGLANVKVAIENMASKEVQNKVTDNSGSFDCQLISGYTYKLQYYKDGFQSNSKIINTGTSVSQDVIGSILLSKTAPAAPIASAPIQTAPQTTRAPMPSTSTVAPSYPSRAISNGSIQAGYAVQIAAIKPGKTIDLNAYAKANSAVAKVYVKEGSDYNRIRVGVFNSRSDAEAARSNIKAAGFGSAYIVKEEGVTAKSGIEEVYTARSYEPGSSNNLAYVLRLAALKSMNNVDQGMLNRYGKIETTRSNGLNIIYLSGFNTLTDANAALRSLQAQGYPSAYVMQKAANGSLQKVK